VSLYRNEVKSNKLLKNVGLRSAAPNLHLKIKN
jgi:hypothetical protein